MRSVLYNEELPDYGELMTVEEFRRAVKGGLFIDYDGSGSPVKNDKIDNEWDVLPSQLNRIPKDATHIMWFNK